MKAIRNVLLALCLGVLLVGCSGSQVRQISSEIESKETWVVEANERLAEIDSLLDNPLIPDNWRDEALEARDKLLPVLRRMEAELPLLRERLREAELVEGESFGNALIGIAEVGGSLGAIIGGPYSPLIAGGAGLLGLIGGWMNGRKRGVDDTLQTIEDSDVPVSITRELVDQQEILRKGNKAVAKGVARLIAKQGVGA